MTSWAALNVAGGDGRDDNVAQQQATEEAQDADNAAMYEQALRCQQRQECAQAKAAYLCLLNGDVRLSRRLEYLCHKNLATMEFEARAFEDALEYFASALALDATDVVVWSQMARTAVETGKLWLARRTLEEGLKVDATYWPLVETLALVLHQVGDDDAYEHVAAYLRQHDPQCALVHIIDEMETLSKTTRLSKSPTLSKTVALSKSDREKKLLKRARKRLQHVQEVVDRGKKRRKQLQKESEDEIKHRSRLVTYTLVQASWTGLGKLLLEAFEEINGDQEADVMRTQVQIQVGYDEEMESEEDQEEEKTEVGDPESDHVLSKKREEMAKVSNVLETNISDNDTQDSGIQVREVMESQPRRRKSRRHEERLREEHAAAMKKAREKDLAYQLGEFLPENNGNDDRKTTIDSVAMEWLPPLNVELVDEVFCISNARNETLSKTASFAFATATEESTSTTELSSSQMVPSEQAAHVVAPRAERVTRRQISSFIRACEGRIIDWVQYYLNQCGRWWHLKLSSDVDELHKVCMWLEKAVNGELDVVQAVTLTQHSVVHVANPSLVQSSRFTSNGLSLGAQLFLLEQHFSVLLQQPVRGKSRRKIRKLVEVQLAEAQKLLFEFGWLEDAEDTSCYPTKGEFVRLFWLIARMHERCANPQMAQHYFTRCREKLLGFKANADHDVAGDFRVVLPNQKDDGEITVELLDEKISRLRFSDVCSEARRRFEAGDYDRVVSILFWHFFPCNQPPRMADFLSEFGADEDKPAARSESDKLFEMVLQSLEQSAKFSDNDTSLFLLTTLYYVMEFLEGLTGKKERTLGSDSPDEACTNALAAIDFLLARLTQQKTDHATAPEHSLLLRGLCVKCLQPSILFRFDSPNTVLSMLRAALQVDEANTADLCLGDSSTRRMIGVDAMARLLYVIRSLSGEEFRKLFTLVPHPAKKKQPRRDRIRVTMVELLRSLNRAFRDDDELARSFPLPKRSALMTLCSTLMKEEEETVAQSDGKLPRQLFGNGAILFLQLYESFHRPIATMVPSQLVELVHLLHERLGRHGICGLMYFSNVECLGDSRKGSCFLEVSTVLLSKFGTQRACVWEKEKSAKKVESESPGDGQNVEQEEHLFQKEVCQCYRCLYDVQILPGCEDHKAGTTFAALQTAKLSDKHEDAMRLIRFAVPILLATRAKNNSQKKERLKLLYAVRDALSNSTCAALSAQPSTVSPRLEAYLAPRGLLQEEITLPFPLDANDTPTASSDEVCLGHLWYLLGANCILGRARRRGNLSELMEMEQNVRERVEFLTKDVLYYHPERVDSWVRLGKTMKELYHAATDAFAAVLGRKLRVRAFQWYTTKILATKLEHGSEHVDVFTFGNVVLQWNLFQKIKEWQGRDIEGHKGSSKTPSSKDSKDERNEANGQHQSVQSQVPIEEFATMYIAQVIEFARRCFDMAARLAEEAVKTHELKREGKGDDSDRNVEDDKQLFDKELDDLQSTIIECNEECGLLLFNLLQEFSLMKEVNLALFPHGLYSRLVDKTFAYFERGWKSCEGKEDAHEDHFRLQYMMGKTLKKRRWCELCQFERSDPEALATAHAMADCFSKAECAREKGDREHALVHAFYALQALRIELTSSNAPSVAALRLVCSHFYEKDDETGQDDDSVDSALSIKADEKKQEDDGPHATSSTIAVNSETKGAKSSKRDEILALLTSAEKDASLWVLNVALARGWLALNIIEALESIPDEDRYFHPSRYVLARIVYWLSTFCSALKQSGHTSDAIRILLDAVQAHRRDESIAGRSVAAALALKEMAPIFDKRRPQIVAIWFSEYIPTAKRFEELNQRQMKYDYYRLKYWRFYVALLQENAAYGRLKEVGSWVLACKEDHDVIAIMLGIVLHARGKVLRVRLQEILDTMESVEIRGSGIHAISQTQVSGEDQPVDILLKQLAKAYAYYLEVLNAQQRLLHIMDDSELLLENAELPMVAVYFTGAMKYPFDMVLPKDTITLDQVFHANITAIKNALRRDELPPRIYDVQGREMWKIYLNAARSYCEEKWPERSGKGKASKKPSRSKNESRI